jgi:hypothetical protein
MVLGIQIVGLLFALFMLYLTFLNKKRKEFETSEYVLWVIFWLIFMYISLFPNTLGFIVASLHISRPLDLLVIVGFLFVILISFYTYTITRMTQNKVENLVRKIAIKKAKK